MRASQISSYLSLTMFLTSFTANAGTIGFDHSLKQNQFEAGAPCTGGSCYNFDADGGLSGPEAQVHKINTFSKNGKDPLAAIDKIGATIDFAAIGKIIAPDGTDGKNNLFQSTGFLISPCLVMTNYHAVFGKSKSPNKTDFNVSFTANRTVTARPISWGDPTGGSVGGDWAVLELENKDCLGLEVGWLKLLKGQSMFDLKDRTLKTAGYPLKKNDDRNPGQLWGQMDCNYQNGPGGRDFVDTLFNDCALNGGQSGSPLMVRTDDGQFRVVGMQALDLKPQSKVLKTYDTDHANVAVSLILPFVDERLALIKSDLERNKANIERMIRN